MNPTAKLVLDRPNVWLSDFVTATVRIEGTAPLVVDLPAEILQPESAAVWRVRPTGPARVESLGPERQAWMLELRLDPFVPGEQVPVALAPIRVKSGSFPITALAIPSQTVTVRTAIRDAKAENVRSITEPLEPPPVLVAPPIPWPFWVIGSLLALLVVLRIVVVRRRSRRSVAEPSTPAKRLAELLAKWQQAAVPPRRLALDLAEILREEIESRFAIPASRRTTHELGAVETIRPFVEILKWCDEVKFRDQEPSAEHCQTVLDAARALLHASDGAPRTV